MVGNETLSVGDRGNYITCSGGDNYTWRTSSDLCVIPQRSRNVVQLEARAPSQNAWLEVTIQFGNSTCTQTLPITIVCGGNPPPPASFAAHYDDCAIDVQFSYVPGATSYQISIDGDPRYGISQPTQCPPPSTINETIQITHSFVQFASVGDHNICVTAHSPCGQSTQKCTFYTVPSGNGPYDGCGFPNPPLIEKRALPSETEMSLTIAPNPVNDRLSFELPEGVEVGMIQVTDLQGQTVFQVEEERLNLDVSTLAKGIYFLRVSTSEGEVLNGKFLKQ